MIKKLNQEYTNNANYKKIKTNIKTYYLTRPVSNPVRSGI